MSKVTTCSRHFSFTYKVLQIARLQSQGISSELPVTCRKNMVAQAIIVCNDKRL